MRLITRKMVNAGVAQAWANQYPETLIWYKDKDEKRERLFALPKNPSKKSIDDIIGNDSWTSLFCHECNRDIERGVVFNEDNNYGMIELILCKKCLHAAVKLLK